MLYRGTWNNKRDYSIEGSRRAREAAMIIKRQFVTQGGPDRLVEKMRVGAAEILRRKLVAMQQRIFDSKRPPQTGEWISVEIEAFVPMGKLDGIVAAIRKAGIVEYVTIKNDGSLHATQNGVVGKEFVVSFPKGEPINLAKLCYILREAKCSVNKTCGLHIHFDMRTKTSRQVAFIGKRVAKCVPGLKMMLPVSRRNNNFCRRDISIRGDRYAFVNTTAYARHQTLEIRGHSGTINFKKIVNWIGILQCIMNARLPKALTIATMDDLLNAVRFPTELAGYMRARVAEFATDTAEESLTEVA